jgi:hypothetical protein
MLLLAGDDPAKKVSKLSMALSSGAGLVIFEIF